MHIRWRYRSSIVMAVDGGVKASRTDRAYACSSSAETLSEEIDEITARVQRNWQGEAFNHQFAAAARERSSFEKLGPSGRQEDEARVFHERRHPRKDSGQAPDRAG